MNYCLLCEAAASDQHHLEFRSRRPDLVDLNKYPENSVMLCRSCHRRLHVGDLSLERSGDWLQLVNKNNRLAVLISTSPLEPSHFVWDAGSLLAGMLSVLRLPSSAMIVQEISTIEHSRTAQKLLVWARVARLRSWSQVITDRWMNELVRILHMPEGTIRVYLACHDHLFPELNMDGPVDEVTQLALKRRIERLLSLPSPILEGLARDPAALQFLDLAEQNAAEGRVLGQQLRRDMSREKGEEVREKRSWVRYDCPNCGLTSYGFGIACRWGTDEPI